MPSTLQSDMVRTAARSVVAPTLFAALPDGVRQRLMLGAPTQRFSDGQLVTLRHEEATGFWLIEAGSVRVGQFSERGDFDAIAQLGPGDSYGELAVLSGQRRVVDAIAQEGTVLRWIRSANYERELANDAVASRALLSALARQLQEQLDAMVERGRLSATGRVAVTLARMASGGQTNVAISQQEIAELVGTTRMTVSTSLAQLESAGLLSRGYGKIEVLDLKSLRRFSRR